MQQFCPSLTLNTNTPCRHACLGAQSAAGPHPRHAPRPTPYAPHPTPPTPLQIHTLVNCQLVIPCWDRRVNLTNNLQTCLVCNNATHNIWSPWQAVYTWFICLNSSWLDAATVIYLLKKKNRMTLNRTDISRPLPNRIWSEIDGTCLVFSVQRTQWM